MGARAAVRTRAPAGVGAGFATATAGFAAGTDLGATGRERGTTGLVRGTRGRAAGAWRGWASIAGASSVVFTTHDMETWMLVSARARVKRTDTGTQYTTCMPATVRNVDTRGLHGAGGVRRTVGGRRGEGTHLSAPTGNTSLMSAGARVTEWDTDGLDASLRNFAKSGSSFCGNTQGGVSEVPPSPPLSHTVAQTHRTVCVRHVVPRVHCIRVLRLVILLQDVLHVQVGICARVSAIART